MSSRRPKAPAAVLAAKPAGRAAWDNEGLPSDDLRELVRMMAAIGVPQATIAACIPTPVGLGVSVARMRELFSQELDTGRAMVSAMIASRLTKAAMACYSEWVDQDGVVHTAVNQAGVNAAMFALRSFAGVRTAGERDATDVFRVETQESEEELEKLESMGAAELQRAISDRLGRR